VIEFLDCVFNSCLKLPVYEIGCWMILSEPGCEEQMTFPGSFAQASSSRLSEIPKDHLCHCTKSRLGELASPDQDNFSSRRASLAWARVRPRFYFCHCKRSRPSESSPPKRDNLSRL